MNSLSLVKSYACCRLETIAAAERNKIFLEAEATAESIRVKGEAEAFAIHAKANAEAEQMVKKADAWKEYREAAMVDMVLSILPKVVAEIAHPLTTTDKITVIASGKGDMGAEKLIREVLNVVNNLPAVIDSLTGVDISKTVKGVKKQISTQSSSNKQTTASRLSPDD